MSMSQFQYEQLLARTERNRLRDVKQAIGEAVSQEMDLHDGIMRHCDQQWPRWKYIRHRPDRPSGIQLGAQDFTCFLPDGRVLCIECKSKTGKLSDDQLIWRAEMAQLGHTVHEVRSMEHFLILCQTTSQTTPTT